MHRCGTAAATRRRSATVYVSGGQVLIQGKWQAAQPRQGGQAQRAAARAGSGDEICALGALRQQLEEALLDAFELGIEQVRELLGVTGPGLESGGEARHSGDAHREAAALQLVGGGAQGVLVFGRERGADGGEL